MKIESKFGIAAAAVAVAIAAAGCSGNVCSQFYSASQSFSTKYATCLAQTLGLDGGVTVDAGCSETTYVNACNNAIGSCTSADQALLQQQVDCFNAIGNLSCSELFGDAGTPAACKLADGGDLANAQTSAACQAAFKSTSVCGS